MQIKEEFLYYLWKFRLIDRDLRTDAGDPVIIINPGEHNTNGGPDFFNARIKLGDTLWAGNVEIHVNSSDWYGHNHHQDEAYDNVILHVVYENDAGVKDKSGKFLQTLTLKGKFPEHILERYGDFQKSKRWIPCEQLISETPAFYFEQWSPALALEHQAEKMKRFEDSLKSCNHDWDECFYQQLCRSFGFRINSQPMELLARSLPFRILKKYTSSRSQLESLLFGQSGLLSADFSEEYPNHLKKEYEYLRQKHMLEPIASSLWRFLRLRPSNFPTIRIAELAGLLDRKENLFSIILENENIETLRKCFNTGTSDYWSTHFIFGRISPGRPKILGDASIDLLMLNFVAPFLLFYGDSKKADLIKERGINLLQQLNGEMNAEIRKWKELGLPVSSALQSQALIQLKRQYCDQKKCLECRIGNVLLNRREG